jgi:hypothetical protein
MLPSVIVDAIVGYVCAVFGSCNRTELATASLE